MTIPLFKTERDKIRYYRSLSEVDRYEALSSKGACAVLSVYFSCLRVFLLFLNSAGVICVIFLKAAEKLDRLQ